MSLDALCSSDPRDGIGSQSPTLGGAKKKQRLLKRKKKESSARYTDNSHVSPKPSKDDRRSGSLSEQPSSPTGGHTDRMLGGGTTCPRPLDLGMSSDGASPARPLVPQTPNAPAEPPDLKGGVIDLTCSQSQQSQQSDERRFCVAATPTSTPRCASSRRRSRMGAGEPCAAAVGATPQVIVFDECDPLLLPFLLSFIFTAALPRPKSHALLHLGPHPLPW